VQAAFLGIKATVIVVVVQALLRLGQKALRNRTAWVLAGAAFGALFILGLPFPMIVLAAGLYGYFTADLTTARAAPPPARARTAQTVLIWGSLWATPLIVLWLTAQEFLLQTGLFFSKLAIVTFGGAYAVLAYMTQAVVQDYGWITTPQMIDALGLAETTPGPLILVTEFVALLAGFAQGGLGLALAAGALTLWVTFTPCFLWIFAAGPYLDHIAARPRLAAALNRITAAVVGVILNLSVWFALHVFFAQVDTAPGLALPLPDVTTLNIWAVVLTALAMGLMFAAKLKLLATLGLMALAGSAISLAGLT
ncbi:MAG: chromate transporter, partial [Pseudomonadota bacterium]